MTSNDLQLIAAASSEPAAERRRISGDIAPIGVVGFTSWGPTIFQAGSIEAPADLRRVKLINQHDQTSAAVGLLAEFEELPDRYRGSFQIPEGSEGDDALLKAAQGLRDGLSVGLKLIDYTTDRQGNLIVKKAKLTEVSLVTVPAFEDARVLTVAAAANTGGNMTNNPAPVAEPLQAQQVAPVPVAAAVAPPVATAAPQLEAQAAPPLVPAGRAQPRAGMDLRAAAKFTADYLRAGNPASGLTQSLLTAALGEILAPADAGESVLRPQYVGELWSADNSARPIIDSLGPAEQLTGTTVVGWRYTDDPEVVEYAGGKTPVFGNEWGTEPVTADVQPFAGGWDIERKYIDLGDPGFIAQTFRRAVKTYKRNSEAFATAELLAAATVLAAAPSVPAALVRLGVQAATIGANISTVKMAADVWTAFAELPEADLPWWLTSQGSLNLGTTEGQAGGIRFAVATQLAAGTVLALDGDAATWYEVDPPIQVRAENIARGGVDLGVFGYGSIIVNDARAVWRQPVTVAP